MLFYVFLVFLVIALVFWSRFQFGEEGKDERGQKILNRSYTIVFPMFIAGWVLIRLVEDFITPLDGDGWRMAVWYLISGIMILHAILIYYFRRIY
ncbi:hypothetical protein [Salisediminibacterium beveridgei]|uniref:Uncharacterized protein n=1 Tax=Salisediminibacterium beveridgei TaxID=632773 RepID=A0A1D7QRV5_9BACI|nr:hypothetical protein [Salisediminibacterium beveridgei]AOM81723.1 hypothetical protein BBEV_0329 [Salisediminibacterium beveridgei]